MNPIPNIKEYILKIEYFVFTNDNCKAGTFTSIEIRMYGI